MRILVCEYVTGGGLLNAPLPASLVREGELMVRALVRDLGDIPGMQLVVTRDPRLPPIDMAGEVVTVRTGDDAWASWRAIMARVDAVWPIAPETDGVLERLSALVLEQGRVLLGTRPDAVAITASKLATVRHLADRGVPVVPTYRVAEAPLVAAESWVIKPDDGAGCLGARCYTREALRAAITANRVPAGCIAQPYIEGVPASLSLLCRDGAAWLLSVNRQRVILLDGEFCFEGVVVNGLAKDRARLAPIGAQVATALSELWGYVGIDLICRPNDALVLEVNPRLTTSYVGLRAALGTNPAARVLALTHAEPVVPDDHGEHAPIDVDVELGCAA